MTALRILDKAGDALTDDDIDFESITFNIEENLEVRVNGKLLAHADGVNDGIWITSKESGTKLVDVGSIEVVT